MKQSSKPLRQNEQYWALLMSLPGLLVLTTFVLIPLLLSFGWSITNKRLISPIPTRAVGGKNYSDLLSLKRITLAPTSGSAEKQVYPDIRNYLREEDSGALKEYAVLYRTEKKEKLVLWIAKDPFFWKALLNTLRFVLVIVPCQGGIALLLALLVNAGTRGSQMFRTIFFAPVVTSMAVIAIIWIFILNQNQGLLNRFFSLFTQSGNVAIPWLTDKRFAHISIYTVSIWQSAGFQMVIFLAGLQGIPRTLYDSAAIDGANALQRFRNVTMPMLRNTTVFVIISTTILAFRVFTQIDIMTKGGPQESTMSLIYYIVQKGFREQRIGYASSVTLVFFLFVLSVSIIQKLTIKSAGEMEE